MWIIYEGIKRSIKSISFSHFKGEIERGSKQQTYRTNHIPYYEPNELTALTWKRAEILFLAPITDYYPKRICDVNTEEAIADGFKSIKEFREGLCQINKVKPDHWGFLINWDYTLRECPSHFDGKYFHFKGKSQPSVLEYLLKEKEAT